MGETMTVPVQKVDLQNGQCDLFSGPLLDLQELFKIHGVAGPCRPSSFPPNIKPEQIFYVG
jgi:hypothetical protein